MFGRWGLLPIAVPAALFIAARLGVLVFPNGRASDRALAGALLSAGLVIGAVRLLGCVHMLTGASLLVVLLALSLALAAFSRRGRHVLPITSGIVTWSTAPLVGCALVAVVIAGLAAYWLPVWQWDAMGYHLPYVNFVLLARGFDSVPDDMPYVSTYPHNVETLMIALRAMLPDDRLVDLAQIPCALLGAIATTGIARRHGAPRSTSLAAGAAWIAVPAVFLQMPTDYVDIASAAFLLAALYFVLSASIAPRHEVASIRRSLLFGGLALGLFLGSKPSAPVAAALVSALLLWAGHRVGEGRVAAVGLALVVVFGGAAYVENAIRFGNPVWPVEVKIGPLRMHGKVAMQYLLNSGAAAPHLHGPLLSRVVRSWTALTSPPVFDMRIGGFGPLVLVAAPLAVVTLIRRGNIVTWGAVGATIVSPDPSVARYVLAFPAVLLALASPRMASLPPRALPWLGALAGALALAQIAYAWPALSGDGPPLLSYARMTEVQRTQAVGADGPPTPFFLARKRIGPDETFAFDQSLELPYLAWDGDLRYRAVWIPDSLSSDRVEGFLEGEKVRVVVAADGSPTGQWLRQQTERFLKLFPCKSAPCSVFARR
jgi:hypothetical protein